MARRMSSVVLLLIFVGAGQKASALIFAFVQVSNHTNSEVDITWVTDLPTSTEVRYGQTTALGKMAMGDAGEIHKVRLSSLVAETTYFFEVISDGQVDNNGSNFYQFQTAKVGALGSFHTLFGTVKDGLGQPVDGTLVVLTVEVSGNDVVWEITNGIGTISEAGLFVATTVSSGTVKASLKSNAAISTQSSTIAVKAGSAANVSLVVSPQTLTASSGETAAVSITVTDSKGNSHIPSN